MTSDHTGSKPFNHLPHSEALFSLLAITSRQPFSYLFGDNVDGYLEATTLSDHARYHHKNDWLLGNVTLSADNQPRPKSSARQATLYPYGIEHRYRGGLTETVSLLSRQRTLCIRLSSDEPVRLGILPQFNPAAGEMLIYQSGEDWLSGELPPTGDNQNPRCFVITASRPITCHLPCGGQGLQIQSRRPENCVTLYISLADNTEQGHQISRKALHDNAFCNHKTELFNFLQQGHVWSDDTEYNRALMWARLAGRTFVSHEYGCGIWAGLPWFKDCWGRDTFIALPGISLVNGCLEEAKAIIRNFAAMQQTDPDSLHYGRIPNRVTSKTEVIYNTTDGTPWMMREILEYLNYSGDLNFSREMYPVLQRYIDGVSRNYLDKLSLMRHRDPDTWMDAKIEGMLPWSPRGDRANDIQVLWYTSLIAATELARLLHKADDAARWQQLAGQVKTSFNALFWQPETHVMADHVTSDDKPCLDVRPNQLMLTSVPFNQDFIDSHTGAWVLHNAVSQLLFPWGICSLDQHNINFHPYHYGQAQYHKDAAYHNGTIWGWNAGFTVSALTRYNKQELAYKLSQNLAQQILNQGHRGTMSENLHAYQHTPDALEESGTYAQAWSVSEFARNAQQDYLGFRPELLHNRLHLAPALPSGWQKLSAQCPFGQNETLQIKLLHDNNSLEIQLCYHGQQHRELHLAFQGHREQRYRAVIALEANMLIEFHLGRGQLSVNGAKQSMTTEQCHWPQLDTLTFAGPDFTLNHAALNKMNYLRNKIEAGSAKCATDNG